MLYISNALVFPLINCKEILQPNLKSLFGTKFSMFSFFFGLKLLSVL